MFKHYKLYDPRIFTFLILLLLILKPSQILPQTELVGHWAMEESSGATVLIDSSSYGNDANVSGSLVKVTGQRGHAQEFDGLVDYALVPDDVSLDITSAITLAAWIKPSKLGTQYIIKKATQGGIDGYELSLSLGGIVFVRFNQATSGNTYRINSTVTYPTDGNTWMHIAATYDGTEIKIYINGTLDNSVTITTSIATNDLSLSIGAQSDGVYPLQGAIDDARVYNYALSQTEIQALTTSWVPLPIPVLDSPADGSSNITTSPTLIWNGPSSATSYRVQISTFPDFSNILFDQSIITDTFVQASGLQENSVNYWRVNATSVTGTSAWSTIWSFITILSTENNGAGYSLDLDGTENYVDCGNNSSVDITGAITMEAWISPDGGVTQSIVKKNTGSTGYELSLSSGIKVFFRLNGNDTYRIDSGTPFIHDGTTWTHVAATYDGTTMKLYMNGILEVESTVSTSIGSNTNNLVIGSDADALETKLFNGRMDEVRLWNVARTETQIIDNMCRKLSGSESGLVGYWRFDEPEGNLLADLTANNNDGILINRDGDEHVWSGAAIGDANAFDYTGTDPGDFQASLTIGSESFTATGSSGTITGIQVYRVDDNSVRTGSNPPSGWTVDPLRYWGVKVFGGGSYDLKYVYTGHSGLGIETDLRLVKRANLSDNNWVDIGVLPNTVDDSLAVANQTGFEYALASTSAPLPVELNSFSAKLSGNEIHLNWQTETEVDNYGFEIERNGFQEDWTKIGFVEGHGNSNSPKEYSFIDKNINSEKYAYRLKQIDTDGSFTYSDVVEIDLKLPDSFHLSQNYPNPFNPTTVINYQLPEAGKVTLSIYDILGNMVRTLVDEEKSAGNYKVEFDAAGLPSGVYFYILRAGSFVGSKKMLLLK
jgi:hypothetical protein